MNHPAGLGIHEGLREGLFVTIDGPNGVGKTTVVEGLRLRLSGGELPLSITKEPSPSPLGDFVRRAENFCEGPAFACLVAADRYQHLHKDIIPALQKGCLVICERYVESSLVLQRIDGLDLDFIWSINAKIIAPHLSIILLAEPGVIEERLARHARNSHRFERQEASSRLECEFYIDAIRFLSEHGFNFLQIDSTNRASDEIITLVAQIIVKLQEGEYP